MLLGDFNEIISLKENAGGKQVDLTRCLNFRENLEECGLVDLGSSGCKFTWHGQQRAKHPKLYERLDYAIANIN